MSKSLSVLILLPMDEYNSFDIYCGDDRLKQIYYEVPKAENYFKTLAGEVSTKTKKGLVKLMNCIARPFLFAFMLADGNYSKRSC